MNVRSCRQNRRRGSVLVIVLWVAMGLVALTLYFANTMTMELRASDNRLSGLASEQAIEAGARYVSAVLTAFATNGVVPAITLYQSEAVPVGSAKFWLIGRPVTYRVEPDQVFFGIVDEGAKVNLNTATLEMLEKLTNMTVQYAANIYDWRNTNWTSSDGGDGPMVYAQITPSYMIKTAPFESVDELKLVYPLNTGLLYGEDRNLNGVLDPGEADTNRNNVVDCGLLEYVTVYSREPNTAADGSTRINVRNPSTSAAQLRSILETNLTTERLTQVLSTLGISQQSGGGGGGGPGGGGAPGGGAAPGGGQQAAASVSFASPLAFYRGSGLTEEEFAVLGDYITVTNSSYVYGRVNVNTAPVSVLASLPGMDFNSAQQLATFREQSPERLISLAWVAEALGDNVAALEGLAAEDCITTASYQFSADIAALGPHGRGYRRVKYVFDLAEGSPRIVYRQDLSHLGWALGPYVRRAYGPGRGQEPYSGSRRSI